METKQLVTMLQKTFDVKVYIEVTETDNAINMRIEKHLHKNNINGHMFSVNTQNAGNNRNAYCNLTITLHVIPDNVVLFVLIQDLSMYINDKFISIKECKNKIGLCVG